MEDVYDCDSVGGDFDAADLFSRADCEVPFDVSEGGARGPDGADASAEFGADCVCGDGDTGVFDDEDYREAFGELVHHWERAADWRDCDVVCGCAEREGGGVGRRGEERRYSHVAYGGYEFAAGGLDWGLPDFVGGVSGDFAVDVDDCGRAIGGDVEGVSAGVFVFPFDTDDGGGDLL